MQELLDRVLGDVARRQSGLEPALVLGAAAIAAVLVLWRPAWRRARHVLTIAHEGGHGVAALLSGRRLAGIRLHADTSGLTVSRGRPRGPGMVATALAGYPAPTVLGLTAAALIARGYALGALWAALVLLALLLLQIRNFFGLYAVLVAGGAVFAVSWWGSDTVRLTAALVVAWFLLLGAPRAVAELAAQRRRGLAPASDADILARITPLPGGAWTALLGLLTVGGAAAGAALLLGGAGGL